MSLFSFIHSRIAMGRMGVIAVSRANRAVRRLHVDDRLTLCRPDATDSSARSGKLVACEIQFRDACAMVNMHHRHHASPVGHLFSGGVFDGNMLCGAVIAGRPVSRHLDDGKTIELTRVVSDGTRNASSKAMGWAIREARRRGYERVITYTLESENGASLRATGFRESARSAGGSWSRPSRARETDRHPVCAKRRWEIQFDANGL